MDYATSDHHVIQELKDLKKAYNDLKTSYEKDIAARNQIEEKLLKRLEILSVLNQYSIDLAEQDKDHILEYIVFKFKDLFKVRAAWISKYDEEASELIVETSTATEKENSLIMKYLGSPMRKHRTFISREVYNLMVGTGTRGPSSLHEISFGQIPLIVSNAIERIFKVSWFESVALVDKGRLHGTLVVAGCKGQEKLDPDVVKIFAELTSNILRRKETEERLQLSEDKFRKAFITSPDSININRIEDGVYVSINQGFTRMTGYSEEDVIGKSSLDLKIWVDPDVRKILVERLRKHGEVENMETSFRMKSGRIIIGIMSATMIDLDGVSHLLTITRDVTEQKIIENELRDSEARLLKSKEQYDKLVTKIPVGIYLLRSFPDRTFVHDFVSPRMAEIFDVSVDELLSEAKYIYERIHPDDRDRFIRLNQEGIIFCKPFDWSGRIISRGPVKWLNISSIPELQKNGDVLWHGIVADITDQKLAEISLIESERLLRETQNIARLGSFVWDIASNRWKSSRILDEIFGIDDEFIRSFEGWISIIHPEHRKMMTDYVTNDILIRHYKFDKEYRIIRKCDGKDRWVHGISELEYDSSNRPRILIGIIIDITDRKNIEEEIRKLNVSLEERVNERTSQLEDANSELQAFAYSVSHDLRAPLRAIDGFSRFILDDYSSNLDAEGQRLLGLIRSNTKKMDKLITDILSLSRVARGEHKISKIDMTSMAKSMLNEAVSTEDHYEISFSIDNLPDAYADPTYIKQVWINLISNAVKFSSLIEKPEIRIGGYTEGGFSVYFVTDNGVGFNMEYAQKLFGVFQRLHRSDEFEGTGVGLAIVQRIIHRHGGKVWAEGKEGSGATFYFSLPVNN